MSNRTTLSTRQDHLLTEMTQRMTALVHQLSTWVQAEEHVLAEMEHQVMRSIKELGNALLTGLCTLLTPHYPERELPCSCGGVACYQRDRPAEVLTILGPLHLMRPYYACASCHHGFAPLDQQLELCAGSVSAALEEVLALLGAREDSFEAAVPVVEKLTLVQVCPNSVRHATERLGQVIAEDECATTSTALAAPIPAPLPGQSLPTPDGTRVYVSMDGVMVHTRDGWKEVKLGAVYTTSTYLPRARPETLQVRTRQPSFVTDIASPEAFGPLLWNEAQRRGVKPTTEVVAIGDGAHWIWKLVEEQFPDAVQIVDWYHASQYVWQVAGALYGQDTDLAKHWAKRQLDRLWNGEAAAVLEAFRPHAHLGEAVTTAVSYFTNNVQRMRYHEYRARGMQIGSGTIESGCKHVIGARLKGAGMVWDICGARAVAKVRARLKSGRWDETIQQRPPLRRTYQRQTA